MSSVSSAKKLGSAQKKAQTHGIPGLNKYIENYIFSLVVRMCIPLVPLVWELLRTGGVSAKSLTLAASLYAISIGVSSWSRSLFALTLLAGVFYIAAFGTIAGQPLVSDQESAVMYSRELSVAGIFLVFVVHSLERWNRHVRDCEPCLDWMS